MDCKHISCVKSAGKSGQSKVKCVMLYCPINRIVWKEISDTSLQGRKATSCDLVQLEKCSIALQPYLPPSPPRQKLQIFLK